MTFFLPLRFARCAVGIIRWCLLWCTGIGLRPEFWLRLRFRLGPGFRLSFRAGFGCRRFGCAFRNRLFSSYLDLFPPRALGLFHDGFSSVGLAVGSIPASVLGSALRLLGLGFSTTGSAGVSPARALSVGPRVTP